MQDYIIINKKDNVAVALTGLTKGQALELKDQTPDGSRRIILQEEIPSGHKFSLCAIGKGERVIKYGNPIGTALEDILPGCLVHTKNVKTTLGDLLEYTYEPVSTSLKPTEKAYFMGYRRPDGRAGIRNQIWIIPTVGCVNSIANKLAIEASALKGEHVDEIIAFPHPYGCSQLG